MLVYYNMTQMPEGKIKEVFKHNLDEELKNISELIEQYNYISMVYN